MGQRKQRKRSSLSLRLQPYEGTPLAEVANYLNSMEKEEATKKVGDILVMCLLPYARLDDEELYTERELQLTCLEASDAMDKHASTMRQALGVEQPKFAAVMYAPFAVNGEGGNSAGGVAKKKDVEKREEIPRAQITGAGSSAEVDLIFGD